MSAHRTSPLTPVPCPSRFRFYNNMAMVHQKTLRNNEALANHEEALILLRR